MHFLLALATSITASTALAKAPAAKAKPAPAKLVTVGEIDGEYDDKMSIINIRLDGHPAWPSLGDVQDHGSFLQLNLPGAIVPEPGKFFDGDNPYLTKVAVFQLTPSDAGIRFFASQDASKIKQALSAELLGNRIMLTIDNVKLKALLQTNPMNTEFVGPPSELAPGRTPTAEAVIAATEVRRDIPAPSALLKGGQPAAALAKAATFAGGGIDMREKLIKVSIFSGIMLALLGASWMLRPYFRRRAHAKGLPPEAAISMKTLATLPLAARQKISLIQVGDEKILIGVTPDHVSFLTAIGKSTAPIAAAPTSFARMLNERPAPLDLRPAPVLKKLAGNDPESLSPTKPAPAPSSAPAPQPSAGNRINVSVGEDGVKPAPPRRARPAAAPAAKTVTGATGETGEGGQKAIDDVTRMIREKLKTLRTI